MSKYHPNILGLQTHINIKWLSSRRLIVNLPTEVVMYGPEDRFVLDAAYGYVLHDVEMKRREDIVTIGGQAISQSWVRQVAVEIHDDIGDDGHVRYQFAGFMVRVWEDQLPKNLDDYLELVSAAHELRNRKRENR
jgi:hypothetical protein